jgi:hypothetical protein
MQTSCPPKYVKVLQVDKVAVLKISSYSTIVIRPDFSELLCCTTVSLLDEMIQKEGKDFLEACFQEHETRNCLYSLATSGVTPMVS